MSWHSLCDLDSIMANLPAMRKLKRKNINRKSNMVLKRQSTFSQEHEDDRSAILISSDFCTNTKHLEMVISDECDQWENKVIVSDDVEIREALERFHLKNGRFPSYPSHELQIEVDMFNSKLLEEELKEAEEREHSEVEFMF